MGIYASDPLVNKMNLFKGDVIVLTDLRQRTGKELGILTGDDLSSYHTFSEIIASSTALDKIVASSTAMKVIANSPSALDQIIASSTALDKVTSSSVAMDEIVVSPIALNKVINSATALYYVCINDSQGKGLEKLAGNIEGTTTVDWESDDKWQTIYDTLHSASELFSESYFEDSSPNGYNHDGYRDRRGDLITLIVSAKSDIYEVAISPRYSGCYHCDVYCCLTTGKHIMWGGHLSYHDDYNTEYCVVKHYMFTPVT